MKIYLNIKTNIGTETVDELDRKDFESPKEFRNEVSRLITEYQIAGMPVYRSQKACKDW